MSPADVLTLAFSRDVIDSFGLIVIFLVMFPALATGLIVFAIFQARGEGAENRKHAGSWGRRRRGDE